MPYRVYVGKERWRLKHKLESTRLKIDSDSLANFTIRSPTGPLPSPEGIHIYEHFNSSTIEWRPPYSSMNNDTIHVDPHITQYTVYITDNYTGNVIVKKNVAEMRFTFNASDNGSCPMYQISAWNAGGEGKLSEKMQGSSPNSKLLTTWLAFFVCLFVCFFFYIYIIFLVPRSIAAGNVITTAASQVLHIDLHVSSQFEKVYIMYLFLVT